MDIRLAPSFANILMGWFEDTYVYTYKVQSLLWKRYIDDIFILWQHGQNKLDEFIQYLNLKHDTIMTLDPYNRQGDMGISKIRHAT